MPYILVGRACGWSLNPRPSPRNVVLPLIPCAAPHAGTHGRYLPLHAMFSFRCLVVQPHTESPTTSYFSGLYGLTLSLQPLLSPSSPPPVCSPRYRYRLGQSVLWCGTHFLTLARSRTNTPTASLAHRTHTDRDAQPSGGKAGRTNGYEPLV